MKSAAYTISPGNWRQPLRNETTCI